MKNLIIIQCLLLCFVLLPFHSCTDNDYNFDKVNEDFVFSQDGLYVPIGSLDTMFLVDMEMPDIETTYVREYKNFFSEALYDFFVISGKNGEDRALGDVSFESILYHKIKNIDTNTEGMLIVKIRALRADGSDAQIPFDDQIIEFKKGIESEDKGIEYPFAFKVEKEYVCKMKDAITLEFTVFISIDSFVLEENDIIILKNMKLKSSGGVAL